MNSSYTQAVPGFPPESFSTNISEMAEPTPNSDLWNTLYPSEGSRSLDFDGLRYHYLDRGSGPVILCVHGNPTWSFYYRAVVHRFAATHRVIAVDHIGCGWSDKPKRSAFPYTLAAHRDNLLRLIDELDLRSITLLAHDWGGAIGLAAAVRRVERMAGIILLNTAAFPPPYVPLRIAACRLPIVGTLAVRGLNAFARAAVTMTTARGPLQPLVAEGLLSPYDRWANRVAIDAFVRDIPMTRRHPTHAMLAELEQDLGRLSHLPKRLIWGMKDWCFRPECLERFLRVWPDADAIRLHNVGHYVIEDAPDETLSAIDAFLHPAAG